MFAQNNIGYSNMFALSNINATSVSTDDLTVTDLNAQSLTLTGGFTGTNAFFSAPVIINTTGSSNTFQVIVDGSTYLNLDTIYDTLTMNGIINTNILLVQPTVDGIGIFEVQSATTGDAIFSVSTGASDDITCALELTAPKITIQSNPSGSYANGSAFTVQSSGETVYFDVNTATALISCPAGITGTTGSFQTLSTIGITGQTGSFTSISGQTGNFNYLYTIGITGQTGSFQTLSTTGITGQTGSFTKLSTTGITGQTGSFTQTLITNNILGINSGNATTYTTGTINSNATPPTPSATIDGSLGVNWSSIPVGSILVWGSQTSIILSIIASNQILIADAYYIPLNTPYTIYSNSTYAIDSYGNASFQDTFVTGITGSTGYIQNIFNTGFTGVNMFLSGTLTASTEVIGTISSFSGQINSNGYSGTTGSFLNQLNTNGYSGTTGSFTSQINSNGYSGTTGAFTSQINSNGYSGTTGAFLNQLNSNGYSGTTGNFSSTVNVNGLTGSTGTFTGILTGQTGNFTFLSSSSLASFPAGITGTDASMATLELTGALNGTSCIFNTVRAKNATNQLIMGASSNSVTCNFPVVIGGATLNFPNSNDTVVARATTDTLTNKTLTAPIIATIVNTGTLTLPTATDTLVARTTTDTLTNKTITGTTNSVDANNLRNGSTYVVTLGGSAPVAGQVLTASSSSAAAWGDAGPTVFTSLNYSEYISNTTNSYSTGTMGTGGVSSTNVTGSGTTWTTAMAGGMLVWGTTNQFAIIIATFSSTTSIILSTAQTITAGTSYTIYYNNAQIDNNGCIGSNNGMYLTGGITGGTGYFTWLSISGGFNDVAVDLTGGFTGTTGTFNGTLGCNGLTGSTGSFTKQINSNGYSGTTGAFLNQLNSNGFSGTTGAFLNQLNSNGYSGTTGAFTGILTGATGNFTNLTSSAISSFNGGITGATASFTYLGVSGPIGASGIIDAYGGITGATASFSYLGVSGPIGASGIINSYSGITGATASFTYLGVSGPIGASGIINAFSGITGTSASFTTGVYSGLISGPAGITGATASFSYLGVSGPIGASGIIDAFSGITGKTGSFSYLTSSSLASFPAGVTGTSSSFTTGLYTGLLSCSDGITGSTISGASGTFLGLLVQPSTNGVVFQVKEVSGQNCFAVDTAVGSGEVTTALCTLDDGNGNGLFESNNSSANAFQLRNATVNYFNGNASTLAINTKNNLLDDGTSGNTTLLGLITNAGGITGATGSFSVITGSAAGLLDIPYGLSGTTGSFTYVSGSTGLFSGVTGNTGSFQSMIIKTASNNANAVLVENNVAAVAFQINTTNNTVTTNKNVLDNGGGAAQFQTIGLPGLTSGGISNCFTPNSFNATMGDGTHNFTLSTNDSWYMTMGYYYFFNLHLIWSSIGSASGALQIGLPITAYNSSSANTRNAMSLGTYVKGITYPATAVQLGVGVDGGNNYITGWFYVSGGTPLALQCSNCAAAGELQLAGMVLSSFF